MRKTILTFVLLSLLVPSLWAGDSARFLNLGFSEDSRFFMFGQYGIANGTSIPYADCYIVDVQKNAFVPQGKWSERFDTRQEAGNDGLGAVLKIVEKNYAKLKSYRINHLLTGRIVYVLIDGQIPISSLEFRDFNSSSLYTVRLNQDRKGSGTTVSSSFWIDVDVKYASGKSATHKIGRPDYYRKGVKEYRIKYLLLAPDGKSLIFVLEKSVIDAEGESIRYMVETRQINN
jgi:predicted secreted protein